LGRTGPLVALLGVAALLGGGCGGTVVDSAGAEALIAQNLRRATGQKVSSVECPSGVEVEKGATFECTVILAGGGRETATVEIRDKDADMALTGLKKQGPGK
jgi:NAD(P)H-hydrate repair Nnr-like enzyme with NAD(P)H-hydrate epimerase domain